MQQCTNVGIVDADSLYFRICFKTKKKHEIRKLLRNELLEIEAACLVPDVMRIAVKGKGNFRNDLYSKYKAHRPPLEEDMKEALAYSIDHLVEEYGAVRADGIEADDLVAIWAHECIELGYDYTICGIDKDLKQIPGVHYNFVKKEFDTVDPDAANYNLMLQCITGDNADGIPGIKGIGPKKAAKLLDGVHIDNRWNCVLDAWRNANAGDPRLSHRLLKMLTSWEEYEEVRNEINGGESSKDESPSKSVECEQDVSEQGTSREVQDEGLQHVSEVSEGEVGVHTVAVSGESTP